jgi:isopentenyl diphosphate isomerase/L-lactate dehydrogenase-like FMN-dependent dehydrogenase
VQAAERLGYRALVVTVDAPQLGNREADARNRFQLPEGLSLGNVKYISAELHPVQHTEAADAPLRGNAAGVSPAAAQKLSTFPAMSDPPSNVTESQGPLETASASQRHQERSKLAALFTSDIDDALTWDLIPFLRSVCSLPIIVKVLPLAFLWWMRGTCQLTVCKRRLCASGDCVKAGCTKVPNVS